MSQGNVEIVRASFEAWNTGDMDAFRELYDPDGILRMDANWREPGPYFGIGPAGKQNACHGCGTRPAATAASSREAGSPATSPTPAAPRLRWLRNGPGSCDGE